MKYDRRTFLLQAGAGLALQGTALAATGGTSLSADDALKELMAGNARFVADKASCPPLTARRLELAAGQSPFAIVLGCSDSRVPIETIFDQIPGNIFVIRVAGNFVDRGGLGSVEYAIAALKAPLIMVLGHSDCGAVKATLAFVKDGTSQPGAIQYVVESIAPAVKNHAASLHDAIAANVRTGVHDVRKRSTIVDDAIAAGHARIIGGVYELHSGKVELLA
ncbi:MAG TPA: carbonic anhydrase [Candidatus Baltobacteraceae bacterium]|nr:carbonic anhydrase [Candidatus Baltobacteraceae bacterium]